MSLNIELDIMRVFDKIEKIKITSQYAKRFESAPPPFTEPLDGTVGHLSGIPIEVDDSIDENIEIIWKEN